MIKNRIIRKSVFSILLGTISLLLIYFILDNTFYKDSQCNVVLTYESSFTKSVRLHIKTQQKLQECKSLQIDTVGIGVYKETFLLPKITPYDKFNISSGERDTDSKINSVVFQYKKNSKTWESEQLFADFNKNNNLILVENGVKISRDIQPMSAVSKESISNIISKIRFVRISFFSLLFALIMSLVSYFFLANFFVNYSIKETILVVLFICIMSTPFLVKYQNFSNLEKRLLVKKPQFKYNTILSYPRDFGEYFSDNFGFRSFMIKIHNYIKLEVLNVSPVPHYVIVGKNNWLFHSGGASLDFYQNSKLYTNEELEKIRVNLERKRDWLKKQNIKFYILIPPIKGRVYPEYLPNNLIKINQKSKLEQLESYLKHNSDIRIINPTKELIQGKEDYSTYYSNDTHWTFFGGLIGYNTLLKEIHKDFPAITPLKLDDFKYVSAERIGNLATMMGIERFYNTKEIKPVYKHPNTVEINNENVALLSDPDFKHPAQLIDNKDGNTLPYIIFFRDSFSNFYFPYIGENFSKGLFLWTHKFKPNIIDNQKPDIVVHEILESFLDELLNEKVEI
jgi:hypothetical protein